MATSFHLCRTDDLDRLVALCARAEAERGADVDEARLRAGLAPLVSGDGAGAAYLLGPGAAPVGFVVLTFDWAPAMAAPRARLADIFIRPSVRGRGLGSEAVLAVAKALGEGGVGAVQMDLPDDNPALARLAQKCGFSSAGAVTPVTRPL